MTARHGAGRDAAEAGIMVVEMLLGMVVRVGTQAVGAAGLDGRNVVG